MIALLLLAVQPPPAQAVPPSTALQPIGRQALPAKGCAAFLWSRGPVPVLIAMATAEPGGLRVAPGGRRVDLSLAGAGGGEAGLGFQRETHYAAGDVRATLEMTIAPRPDLSDGAVVTDATLSVERAGADTELVPVGGLIGCAAQR